MSDNNQTEQNNNADEILKYLKFAEPFSGSVNGEELLSEISCMFKKYVHLPVEAPTILALWVIHTYAFQQFEYTPRLVIYSPEPRCGKTTLINLIKEMCNLSLMTTNITAAATFRMINQFKPTLLIDEADTFLKNNEDLRGILNTGYHCEGKILRMVDKSPFPGLFDCFAPCAIASIGTIQQTIMDRSILIPMERSMPNEQPQKLRIKEIQRQTEVIRQKCAKFAENIRYNSQVVIPEELNSRQQDIWEVLLTIAETISPMCAERTRQFAVSLAQKAQKDYETLRLMLLTDIREIFLREDTDSLQSTWLCDELGKMEERPWKEICKGKQINPAFLANQLKFFGIRTEKCNYGSTTKHLYIKDKFASIFLRYLPPIQEKTPASSTEAQQATNEEASRTVE